MNKEDYITILNEIRDNIGGDGDSVGLVSNHLASLSEDYSEQLKTISQLQEENKKLSDVNERLLDENRKLFMHLPIMTEQKTEPETPPEEEITIDDLWDNNGRFVMDRGYNEKE